MIVIGLIQSQERSPELRRLKQDQLGLHLVKHVLLYEKFR